MLKSRLLHPESGWQLPLRDPARTGRRAVRIPVYAEADIMQRIFSSATRRELLGKHLEGWPPRRCAKNRLD